MEREDSFEAIVAKAVYEVNPQPVARPQQLKIAALALAPFIAALEALRHPKSHHLSHAAVGNFFLWRVVGFVAGGPGPRGTEASSRGKPPPKQKAWTGYRREWNGRDSLGH